MSKQKRMIYVYEENLEYYDTLENKSQFLNDALQDARIDTRIKRDKPAVEASAPLSDTQSQIDAMRARDAEALRKSRER